MALPHTFATQPSPVNANKADANFAYLLSMPAVNAFAHASTAEIVDIQARTRTLDHSAIITAALAAAGPNKRVVLPAGSWNIVTGFAMAGQAMHLHGMGPRATELWYAPTANGTCCTLGSAAALYAQGSLKHLSFYSSDSTFTKIALDIVDTTGWNVEDIVIGGSVAVSGTSYWSGATSIGIRTRGRECCGLKNLYIAADLPINIADNPSSTIDIDHFNFHNCILFANAQPCIKVDSGVNLTQVSFTGYLSMNRGTDGFRWVDTATSEVSNGLSFENLRAEQGTDAAAYLIRIEHNYELQGLRVNGAYGGLDRKGVYLRKCSNVLFEGGHHVGATEALNIDATVKGYEHRQRFFQTGSTKVVTGQRIVSASPFVIAGALPPDLQYAVSADADRNEVHDGVLSASSVSLAVDATADIGITGTTAIVAISTSEGVNAIFALNGTNNTTTEISDPSGVFSAAAGTASSINIYYSSGYKIQNKRPATVRAVIVPLGSYTAI